MLQSNLIAVIYKMNQNETIKYKYSKQVNNEIYFFLQWMAMVIKAN